MKRIVPFIVAASLSFAAWAHDAPGEIHPPAAPDTPRAAAHSEDFELVAVPVVGELRLYLDRYATNAPVSGARVEVESGAFRATARETEAGVYTVPGDVFTAPGRHPLSVSVETDDTADLLAATLDLGGAAAAHHGGFAVWTTWSGGGLLAGVAAMALWRRRGRAA